VSTPRRTGGLGRGLGALIPTGPSPDRGASSGGPQEVAGARFAELPVDRVSPNPLQPRQHFDEEAMAELVTSITEVGLLQPVVVREIDADEAGPRYELVMGERRWRAAQQADLATIPAIVRETSDDDMLRDALLENLHRQQLNPLEEAAAYQQLLNEFGATHEELAARIGRSRPQISNTIRLLNLPAPVQRRVAAGVLSAGHARAILGLPTHDAQEAMAERVVAEGMSVRGVEEAVHVANSSGSEPAKPSAPRGKRPVPAGLVELGERLSDRLETRVKVDLGRKRGKVVIEFATIDDLQRIVAVIDGDAAAAVDPGSVPEHEGHDSGHDTGHDSGHDSGHDAGREHHEDGHDHHEDGHDHHDDGQHHQDG
jgi:ParB family transcriptional regulator, chromosome partitioning protein